MAGIAAPVSFSIPFWFPRLGFRFSFSFRFRFSRSLSPSLRFGACSGSRRGFEDAPRVVRDHPSGRSAKDAWMLGCWDAGRILVNALNCCKGRCVSVSVYLCVLGRNKCANKVTIRVELVGTSSSRDIGELGRRGKMLLAYAFG